MTSRTSLNTTLNSTTTSTKVTKSTTAGRKNSKTAPVAALRKPPTQRDPEEEDVDDERHVCDLDTCQPLPVVGADTKRKRFFASSFADRNKREAEKRFFDVINKKPLTSATSTTGTSVSSAAKATVTAKKPRGGRVRRKSLDKIVNQNQAEEQEEDIRESHMSKLTQCRFNIVLILLGYRFGGLVPGDYGSRRLDSCRCIARRFLKLFVFLQRKSCQISKNGLSCLLSLLLDWCVILSE